jgi:sn-glycerol 3-phosphate transport system ATP-binding protein
MNLIRLRDSDIRLPGTNAEAGILGIRPEDLQMVTGTVPDGGVALDLTVETIERVGAETYVYGRRPQQQGRTEISARPGELPPGEILVRIPGQEGPAIGETIRTAAVRDKLHLFSSDGRKRIAL